MMDEAELHDRVSMVVRQALTEMKCMVLRAQHLREDIAVLQIEPTAERVAAFCRKHDRLLTP